ncbi:MAG: SDR family oxidoreductase [Nocardioides sp.]|nr:SDR family oxidoreductase [Nocardioides sp.]
MTGQARGAGSAPRPAPLMASEGVSDVFGSARPGRRDHGGAGGLGAPTAKAFLAEGARVAIVDLSQDALDATAENLAPGEGRLITVAADVSRDDEVKRYIDVVVEKWGRIDAFFNHAGIEGKVAPIVDQAVADFDRLVSVNIRGTWLGLHYVLPVMYAQRSGS